MAVDLKHSPYLNLFLLRDWEWTGEEEGWRKRREGTRGEARKETNSVGGRKEKTKTKKLKRNKRTA